MIVGISVDCGLRRTGENLIAAFIAVLIYRYDVSYNGT